MRAFAAITRATVRQVLGLRRAILSGLAMILPAVVFLLTSRALADDVVLDRLVDMGVSMYFPLMVPIVSLIIASSSLGDERRDGTLSFLVLRPIPRSVIAAAKFTGAALAVSALDGLGGAALGFVYGLKTGSWNVLLPFVVGGVVAGIIYTALFVPLGFFTDRAVLIGLVFVLVFENGVVSALHGLTSLSPWRFGVAALAALSPEAGPIAITDLGVRRLPGLPLVLLITVVFVAASVTLTALVLRRRDLT